MMRSIVFALLKVLEIGAVVFVPYWSGVFVADLCGEQHSVPFLWFFGVLILTASFCVCYGCFSLIREGIAQDFLCWFIELNRKWSAAICERIGL